MEKFKGKIEIHGEICCEVCNEIIHNHLDCPVCKKQNAPSDNYGHLSEFAEEGQSPTITCACGAIFQTKDCPYDSNAIWEQL